MRREPIDEDYSYSASDWRDAPEETLEAVDALLEPHGLEIITADGGDCVLFRVERREK